MNKIVKAVLLLTASFFGVVESATASLISQNLGASAYSSSSNWGTNSPSEAFDGTIATGGWNAGAHPTQWIEVNLGHVYSIDVIGNCLQSHSL